MLIIGVVCSSKESKEEVVSTMKSAAKDEEIEEYTPEVEEPRAIISELPVETIEGIGSTYGEKLRAVGIVTVQDLLGSTPEVLVNACGVSTEEARRWIAMSRFCWIEGISEEDAEAIVVATGIETLDALAAADPDDLLARINDAVSRGNVKVPEGYTFTIQMARRWIAVARDLTV
jgi:predicted flap endonuclease-1-like 5' DNA nuclease